MILQELVHLYETLSVDAPEKIPKQGWCQAGVSYALGLNERGELEEILPLRDGTGDKQFFFVPEMEGRSSTQILPYFLCDKSEYLLGIDAGEKRKSQDNREKQKDQKRQEYARQCFQAAKEKHLEILFDVHSSLAEAVRNFFLSWKPENAKEHPVLRDKWNEITAGYLIFAMGGSYAQEDEEIKRAWEVYNSRETSDEEGICLVTGQKAKIRKKHHEIKGVWGAQSSGAKLVSFNERSFESYGKEQSYNAPVGTYAVFAYKTALNYLLSQKKYVYHIGDTTVVYWSENGADAYQEAYSFSLEPIEDNQEIVKGIFDNLARGEAIAIRDIKLNPEQKFYILGLAPSAGRLSVRFFYENSFGHFLTNLRKHYDRMNVVRPQCDKKEYLGIWKVLQETVKKSKNKKKESDTEIGAMQEVPDQKTQKKEAVPGLEAEMMQAILSGGRYPDNLYSSVLMRIRAEQGNVTRGRAAIIKAFLLKNSILRNEKEECFVGLNEECNDAAYVLGREFAVLEKIQKEANPDIKATIKDRRYNSASTTPAVTFPALFRLKNSHIRKIEKEEHRIYFEKLLADLQGRLSEYPTRLSLGEQGLFHLGYYHQMQKFFEKKEEV